MIARNKIERATTKIVVDQEQEHEVKKRNFISNTDAIFGTWNQVIISTGIMNEELIKFFIER